MERNSQLIIVGVMLLVILGGFGIFIAFAPKTPAKPAKTVDASALITPTSHMTGSPTAKATIVEWGDFECPFCGAEAPVLEQVIAKYGTNPNFNFVFRNFPLPQHANARAAAEAAEAAGAQGKYFDMYAALYANQNAWTAASNPRSFFDTYAKAIGLDVTKFDAALDAHTFAKVVEADYQAAMALQLDHTPTLFLNGVEQADVSALGLSKAIDAVIGSTTAGS